MSLVSGKNYSVEITSRKNIIINGNMDVNQRGFTSLAIPNGAGFEYVADRLAYYNDRSTGAATISRSTDVPTYAESDMVSTSSANVEITTALATPSGTNEAEFIYAVEGYDYKMIAEDNATLSFWVKSNLTGLYSCAIKNSGNDRSYVTEYTIDVADTWEKKIITFPLTETAGTWDYTTGVGLSVYFNIMSFANTTSSLNQWLSSNKYASTTQVNLFGTIGNYFRMTGVQFEAGTVATEFEKRFYSEELALCQRYYTSEYIDVRQATWTNGIVASDNHSRSLLVPMRAAGTVGTSGLTLGAAVTLTSVTILGDNNSTVVFVLAFTANANNIVSGKFTVDAELS